MDSYIEVKVKSSKQCRSDFNELIKKLHDGFVRVGVGKLGVSFPFYSEFSLGLTVRVHGTERDLCELDLKRIVNTPGVSLSEIKTIPGSVKWALFSRVRPSKQLSKLNARERDGLPIDRKAYLRDMCQESLVEPYFSIRSGSNGHHFRVFVSMSFPGDVCGNLGGGFDSYGLSKSAVVPLF